MALLTDSDRLASRARNLQDVLVREPCLPAQVTRRGKLVAQALLDHYSGLWGGARREERVLTWLVQPDSKIARECPGAFSFCHLLLLLTHWKLPALRPHQAFAVFRLRQAILGAACFELS